jgi:hypothetical protein
MVGYHAFFMSKKRKGRSKKLRIIRVHLQINSNYWYFAVFPALKGQVKPAQGKALG